MKIKTAKTMAYLQRYKADGKFKKDSQVNKYRLSINVQYVGKCVKSGTT